MVFSLALQLQFAKSSQRNREGPFTISSIWNSHLSDSDRCEFRLTSWPCAFVSRLKEAPEFFRPHTKPPYCLFRSSKFGLINFLKSDVAWDFGGAEHLCPPLCSARLNALHLETHKSKVAILNEKLTSLQRHQEVHEGSEGGLPCRGILARHQRVVSDHEGFRPQAELLGETNQVGTTAHTEPTGTHR